MDLDSVGGRHNHLNAPAHRPCSTRPGREGTRLPLAVAGSAPVCTGYVLCCPRDARAGDPAAASAGATPTQQRRRPASPEPLRGAASPAHTRGHSAAAAAAAAQVQTQGALRDAQQVGGLKGPGRDQAPQASQRECAAPGARGRQVRQQLQDRDAREAELRPQGEPEEEERRRRRPLAPGIAAAAPPAASRAAPTVRLGHHLSTGETSPPRPAPRRAADERSGSLLWAASPPAPPAAPEAPGSPSAGSVLLASPLPAASSGPAAWPRGGGDAVALATVRAASRDRHAVAAIAAPGKGSDGSGGAVSMAGVAPLLPEMLPMRRSSAVEDGGGVGVGTHNGAVGAARAPLAGKPPALQASFSPALAHLHQRSRAVGRAEEAEEEQGGGWAAAAAGQRQQQAPWVLGGGGGGATGNGPLQGVLPFLLCRCLG